ncbi:MAG: acetyl-CoA carboxylase biotin carboxyl carrier protein [Bryobacteraceae bacterium]
MTLDEIRELIKLATETNVAELEVQRGDNRVRIALTSGRSISATPPAQTLGIAASAPLPQPAATPPSKPDPTVTLVKSPIVGTFYESSGPNTPPFVRVGEAVQPGKVLCIIESMKLMNEIEAEVAGVIESKLVPNGQPVEYGEALFAIRAV